jgi:hypothetical protein
MTCDEVRERLDVYLEGGLSHEERAAVAAHLEACAACRAEAAAWRELFERAAALPRSIEPPRDLWPSIDAALDEPHVMTETRVFPLTARLRPLWLVAAALALIVVTAAITTFVLRQADSAMARKLKGLEPTDTQVVEPGAGPSTEELLRSLEAQHLPPETMAIVQRNLAVIDVAIAELEAALEQDPGNVELARMLVSTHRKKAELVERAVRAAEDS